jgi:arsenate reductase
MGGRGVLTPRRPDAVAKPQQPDAPVRAKKRVLFLCIGNSCRSQMAEGFARAYGADIIQVQSAGLMPAVDIAPMTKQVLAEWNINIDDQFPKGLEVAGREPFDILVNMSGQPVNLPAARILTWPVRDPIGQPISVYRSVVQQIEALVMGLILSLRAGRGPG